jgi:hypothetical protein
MLLSVTISEARRRKVEPKPRNLNELRDWLKEVADSGRIPLSRIPSLKFEGRAEYSRLLPAVHPAPPYQVQHGEASNSSPEKRGRHSLCDDEHLHLGIVCEPDEPR